MKIAMVVHDYHRMGGHSRYTVELAERFAREHEVHVFTNRIDIPVRADIQFHHVRALRSAALTTVLTFPIPATAAIGRGFDIVHAQGLACFGANVVTAHICNRAWYNARRRSNDAIRAHERLFGTIVNRAEAALYRRSTGAMIIAVSRLVAQNLADAYGRAQGVTVIPHGVDLERFSPDIRGEFRPALRRELGISESELVALWVGDLRKGAATAIEAMADAPDWRLVLVSRNAPEPYMEYAARCGVGGRVTFAPATDAVEKFYAASDAFVFPSEYDAFGMVVTEAMASGLPVLVSRAAGAAELVDDGVTGAVFDPAASPAEYARQLSEWSADRPRMARLGQAAREAMRPFTWDEIASRTLEVYDRAAGGHRP